MLIVCRYIDPLFIIYFADDSNVWAWPVWQLLSATGYGYVITSPNQGANFFFLIITCHLCVLRYRRNCSQFQAMVQNNSMQYVY